MKAQFLPLAQQQRQGNPLLGTLGSIAGGAVGTAVGGPLGSAAGSALGGQLLGQGTIDPMAAANQTLQSEAGNAAVGEYIMDPLKGAMGFSKGGPAWYDVSGQMAERRKKLTGKTDAERKANPPKYRAMGGEVAPKEEFVDSILIQGAKYIADKLANGEKKEKKEKKTQYKSDGGMINHGPGDDGFMSAYQAKTVGPLAGVKFKQSDGKVTQEYEKKYHNPLAKPAGGGSDK